MQTENKIQFREQWLFEAADLMDLCLFDGQMPAYRVTCGWPSHRALAPKSRVIGQCFSDQCSEDQTHELIVSMVLDDPVEVLATLVHEMVHAFVGVEHGHRKPFKAKATQIGLVGKMTATQAGEVFKRHAENIVKLIGDYPHAKVDHQKDTTRKKQTTRLLKAECDCGYNVRVTKKWLEQAGAPHCPLHGEMKVIEK